MSTTETNPYAQIKAYERAEFDRLSKYLAALDAAGWVEQSYCTDWLVYQAVSHLGSGARIAALRLQAWVANGPPVTREMMQGVWGHFDALAPEQMLTSYTDAVQEYLAAEAATPDAAGLQEVEGFLGRRSLAAYQTGRLSELALHSWDIYVARDRRARLHRDAVAIAAGSLQNAFLALDKDRAVALTTNPIGFKLTNSGATYTLDLSADRPRVQPSATADYEAAPLAVEGPDEEAIRFTAGRQIVPGCHPELKVTRGTPQELAALRRAFR
ncbi:MAG: maleylpyruvate isomerase N-terminal domain-containing protein [Chloroflexi bacterium]|nr:maleylpyruvate isomerase N-terminal domain-containing protein [Chloroflexota bacterium]